MEITKHKSSTLIVAGKCKDGVIIAADRRTMRGTEHREEKKLYEFYEVITAFAGLTGLKDKFLETVEVVLRSTRAMDLSEAITGVEDTMAIISERYRDRLGESGHIEALLAGLEHLASGNAKLYHVLGDGYAERVDFLCIGHGSPYATCLSKGLYRPDMSMKEIADIAIFLISWVENVDSSVGGIPDVVFMKNDKGIETMDHQETEKIYKNAKKIAKTWCSILPKAIINPTLFANTKE